MPGGKNNGSKHNQDKGGLATKQYKTVKFVGRDSIPVAVPAVVAGAKHPGVAKGVPPSELGGPFVGEPTE